MLARMIPRLIGAGGVVLAAGCTFGGIADYSIEECDPRATGADDACNRLNEPGGCTIWQCNGDTKRCAQGLLDYDRDGDPSADCGGSDCNDSDAKVSSTFQESCDGKDNNCDGFMDEGVLGPLQSSELAKVGPLSSTLASEGKCDVVQGKCRFVAKDADGDGHTAANCKPTSGGAVETGDDCDDADAKTYPGSWDGPELIGDAKKPNRCDNIDQDCDGQVDDDKNGTASCKCDPANPQNCAETATGEPISALNANNNGIGACKFGKRDCDNGVPGKCVGAVGPKSETCDKVDEDCNGKVDDDAVLMPWWSCDKDDDQYSDKTVPNVQSCSMPETGCKASWYVACTGTPADCAGVGADQTKQVYGCCIGDTVYWCQSDNSVWTFHKSDCTTSGKACVYVAEYKSLFCDAGTSGAWDQANLPNTDCDDGQSKVHPDATELCTIHNMQTQDTPIDENCNGTIDEGYPGVLSSCDAFDKPFGSCINNGTWYCDYSDPTKGVCNPDTTGIGIAPENLSGSTMVNGSWDSSCDGIIQKGICCDDSVVATTAQAFCSQFNYNEPACTSAKNVPGCNNFGVHGWCVPNTGTSDCGTTHTIMECSYDANTKICGFVHSYEGNQTCR
jgi:hypothetical protein